MRLLTRVSIEYLCATVASVRRMLWTAQTYVIPGVLGQPPHAPTVTSVSFRFVIFLALGEEAFTALQTSSILLCHSASDVAHALVTKAWWGS